jgi:cyanophycinase
LNRQSVQYCSLQGCAEFGFGGLQQVIQFALQFRYIRLMSPKNFVILAILVSLSLSVSAQHSSYQYFRIGQKSDSRAQATAGYALMGGGKDLDEAFRWLCAKANGGDFLVLRAADDDAYNPYIKGLCQANSVATLIIPDLNAASDPAVADIIGHAEAVFIAGGDQAHYIRAWQNTAVQQALNAHIAAGKPIGGTSAGLAVLGEFVYSALNDPPDGMLASPEALKDPFTPQVALVRNFLSIPLLHDTITDSHFAKRDRLGRSLVFLARLMQDGWTNSPREIAVDEKSAVLIERDGRATVVGSGKGAYFFKPTQAPATCKHNMPLTFLAVSAYKAPTGSHFDVFSWKGEGGASYTLDVKNGEVTSTQPENELY